MKEKDLPVIRFDEEKPQKKEPFKFEYTMPSLDWYETIRVEIKPDDYCYFKLQRRYGRDWWLIGKNPPVDGAKEYRWTEKEIGRISVGDIVRLVDWAKLPYGGSKITEISVISGAFGLLREIEELMKFVNRGNGK